MHIVNLICPFLFFLEKEITCLRGGVAVKPNEAPWVVFVRKKAVLIISDSKDIFHDFAHCETLSVTFQNDVLKFQKAFRGIYHLSKLVNGKPSFSNNKKAIWYMPSSRHLLHNEWVFGNMKSIESLNPIVNLRTVDNQGDLDLTNVPSKKWKYIRYKKWRDVLTEKDVSIECTGESYLQLHTIYLRLIRQNTNLKKYLR